MIKILTKLHAIAKDVAYIQKDKKNTHQGYTYASEKAIKEALHESLVKHGVVFTLSTSNPRVENGVTWIDCAYRFLCTESGEELTGTFLGSGSARDEKGHYAAVTGAIKYILTSTFLIPTGDDPEEDEPEAKPKAANKPVAQPVDDGLNLPDQTPSEAKLASPKQIALIASLKKQKNVESVAEVTGITATAKTMTMDQAKKIIAQLLELPTPPKKELTPDEIENQMLEDMPNNAP